MARRVLLVDPDLDARGELSASLRGNGFTVTLADSVDSALERAKQTAPDIIVASIDVCRSGELGDRLKMDPELATVPSIVLVDEAPGSGLPPGHAVRRALHDLMAKIVSAPSRSLPAETPLGEERGDLSQVPLSDLLQILSMDKRSGILSVSTAAGSGEARISEGEIFDAVYRRLEGEKALYRLLGEREGSFVFVPGATSSLRRVAVGTSMLVMEAMRQFDEVARLRSDLAPGGDALLASGPADDDAPRLEREIVQLLQMPRSIEEILDEVQSGDLAILQVIRDLARRGRVRRIPRAALVTRLASDDRLQMLRGLVSRLTKDGFAGSPRIAIAAPSNRLASLAGAILRIEETVPPLEPLPSATVPHELGTLRFGESVELDVTALPLVGGFSPLWGLSLASTGAVIRLDSTECPEFDAACAAAEVPVFHAAALIGDVEEGDPIQVAALLRATLESAAGT